MQAHKKELQSILQQIKIQFPVEQKKYHDAGVRANAKAYESKDVSFGPLLADIWWTAGGDDERGGVREHTIKGTKNNKRNT